MGRGLGKLQLAIIRHLYTGYARTAKDIFYDLNPDVEKENKWKDVWQERLNNLPYKIEYAEQGNDSSKRGYAIWELLQVYRAIRSLEKRGLVKRMGTKEQAIPYPQQDTYGPFKSYLTQSTLWGLTRRGLRRATKYAQAQQ